jgi:hypothetical protein
MVQPITPNVPRRFTFTHEGQAVTVYLRPEYEAPGLVIHYSPKGEPIDTALYAWNTKTKNHDRIAQLIRGEWIAG